MKSPKWYLAILITVTAVSLIMAKNNILSIRHAGKDFEDVLNGLTGELKNDFDIKDQIITKKTTVNELTAIIKTINPKLIVLMDNSSISLFKKYQATLLASQPFIPSVALMGVFIKDAIHGLKNVEGISYEIPVLTSVISLRSVLGIPIKKVGIIHREFLNEFLTHNKKFCNKEGIEISHIALPNKNDNYYSLLKKGLKTLLEDNDVDALWIPNDKTFLHPDMIKGIWIPAAKKYKKPVIVGVEVLVNPKLDFGTLAVLPDYMSLGSQAAEMIYEIMDHDWQCHNQKVEWPLAVYKIFNITKAKKNYKVTDENLKTVDKIIK